MTGSYLAASVVAVLLLRSVALGAAPAEFVFDGSSRAGAIAVAADLLYSDERGFGFEPGSADAPRSFSVALPEGNYRVSVVLGRPDGPSVTTVKAELRRLMLEAVRTGPGERVERSFIANIRTARIDDARSVSLKPREKEMEWAAWDNKLTLEFCGDHPAVAALKIEPADVPTVFLLGDSTVCDQPGEPWASWGQMLPRWFKPDIAIANHAESGEALRTSLNAHRLEKILSLARPGDWLFIQFGHNDMKAKGEGVGAFTTYKADLTRYVTDAKAKQVNVVLVTSCERKAGAKADTLGDYPEAVRQTAKEQGVPVIDLHALSRRFYAALGEQLDRAFQDGTHHNNYGAYEISKIIVQEIKAQKLGLGEHVADDFGSFDPAVPDDVTTFEIAPSASRSTTKPLGN